MPCPRHEAELEWQAYTRAWRNCGRQFTHPREIPGMWAESWRLTRDYYAARDTVDLERGELIELISYARTMAMKLTGYALLIGLMVAVIVAASCKSWEKNG